MKKTIKKRFDIDVPESDKTVSKTFELDKDVIGILGMVVVADRDDQLYFRGSQKLDINGIEIFPENYECKLLMAGINVPPNDKYYDLGGMPPGNRAIKVDYKDTNSVLASFNPYRVSYYFLCETS